MSVFIVEPCYVMNKFMSEKCHASLFWLFKNTWNLEKQINELNNYSSLRLNTMQKFLWKWLFKEVNTETVWLLTFQYCVKSP